MPSRFIGFLFMGSLAVGCAHGVMLYETSPVLVTARPPDPPPAPPPPVIRETIVVRDAIHFDTNRDSIKSESTKVLDEVAQTIQSHPELTKIRIEGHTDTVGKAADNVDLSKRRAIAVRTYLMSKGIDGARLIAEGYGGDNPIAPNTTETGRAMNRRVAFTILDRSDGGETVTSGKVGAL